MLLFIDCWLRGAGSLLLRGARESFMNMETRCANNRITKYRYLELRRALVAALLVVSRRVSRFSRCNVVYISQRLLLKGQRMVKSSLIAATIGNSESSAPPIGVHYILNKDGLLYYSVFVLIITAIKI